MQLSTSSFATKYNQYNSGISLSCSINLTVAMTVAWFSGSILSATMFKTEQLAKGYINNNINKKERYKYSTLNCDKLLLANENYSSIVLHNLYENINTVIT